MGNREKRRGKRREEGGKERRGGRRKEEGGKGKKRGGKGKKRGGKEKKKRKRKFIATHRIATDKFSGPKLFGRQPMQSPCARSSFGFGFV